MNTSDKKQIEAELTEVQCPECLHISYRGDWENIRLDSYYFETKCPKCGAICDVE